MLLANNNMEIMNCAEIKHNGWFSRLARKFQQKTVAEETSPVPVFPVDESNPFSIAGWDIQ